MFWAYRKRKPYRSLTCCPTPASDPFAEVNKGLSGGVQESLIHVRWLTLCFTNCCYVITSCGSSVWCPITLREKLPELPEPTVANPSLSIALATLLYLLGISFPYAPAIITLTLDIVTFQNSATEWKKDPHDSTGCLN